MSADELAADGFLTVTEASKFSGIGRSRLYQMMTAGELAFSQVGARRLVSRASLKKLLLDGLVNGPVAAPVTTEGRP